MLVSGQVVSEISLWMYWKHAGDLCSKDYGHCLEIGVGELINAITPHSSSLRISASYAQRFVNAAKYFKRKQKETSLELMALQQVLEVEQEARELQEEEVFSTIDRQICD